MSENEQVQAMVVAAREQFQTTRWSLVLAARGGSSPEARQALEQLVQCYWYPLYSYLRRRGCDHEASQDLTQGFFARLLERRDLDRLTREGGRFRSFLLTALKHFFLAQREKSEARKRGGDQPVLSIHAGDAEARYAAEPHHEDTPERAYERAWARAVLQRAVVRLESCYRGDETGRFEALKGQLVQTAPGSQAELAARLSISEGAVRVALHRMRQRFARCLREEVSDTLSSPADVEDELNRLLQALAK